MKTKWILAGLIFLALPRLDAAVIGYWRFENNLLDSSGNSLNATGGTGFGYSSNVPGSVIEPGSLTNLSSYQQGSAGSTVSVNSPMSTTFSLGSFTVEAFVYLNPLADNFQQILSNRTTGEGIYFSVGTSMSGYMGGANGFGGDSQVVSGSGLDTQTWYHVAWVGFYQPNNGTAVQFYVNGDAVGGMAYFAANGATHILMSDEDWLIGGPSNNFNGLIDELRISNEALTPSQFLTAVPEPSSIALLVLGALPLALRRRKTARV